MGIQRGKWELQLYERRGDRPPARAGVPSNLGAVLQLIQKGESWGEGGEGGALHEEASMYTFGGGEDTRKRGIAIHYCMKQSGHYSSFVPPLLGTKLCGAMFVEQSVNKC
eukprot:Hpha_TRINITY_DN16277_c3_g2::TRINITY_DN16277_c3_g2_i1::g.12147::m.12147